MIGHMVNPPKTAQTVAKVLGKRAITILALRNAFSCLRKGL